MTVTDPAVPNLEDAGPQQSLSTQAARNLATTTKSVPQMQAITSRWLLRLLPWVEASGGAYRVNRRLSYAVGDGRVTFVTTAGAVEVIPAELGELPILRGFEDQEVLAALAGKFEQREYEPGDVIVEFGHASDQAFLIAHGKVSKVGPGEYGDFTDLGVLAGGDHFGDESLLDDQSIWEYTVKAVTSCTVLVLEQRGFDELVEQSEALREQIELFRTRQLSNGNEHGEASIELSSGHSGEWELPGTFVDYELSPREYELSVAQTVLRVHSRVADLYNQPMNQTEQQLRLTIEALRERQESELLNNKTSGCSTTPTSSSACTPAPARRRRTTWTTCWARCGRSRRSSWPTPRRSRRSGASATRAGSTRQAWSSTATTCRPGAGYRSCRPTRSRCRRHAPARSC